MFVDDDIQLWKRSRCNFSCFTFKVVTEEEEEEGNNDLVHVLNVRVVH